MTSKTLSVQSISAATLTLFLAGCPGDDSGGDSSTTTNGDSSGGGSSVTITTTPTTTMTTMTTMTTDPDSSSGGPPDTSSSSGDPPGTDSGGTTGGTDSGGMTDSGTDSGGMTDSGTDSGGMTSGSTGMTDSGGMTSGSSGGMADVAVVSAGPGLGQAITDDSYDGMLASMSCVDLMVADDGVNTVDDVALEIGVEHTWVGDLTIKVVSPTGTVVTAMNRPGAAVADDGTAPPFGNGSNLSAASPITFADGGVTDAELLGAGLMDNDVSCLTDGLCDYFGNPDGATGAGFADFIGENSVGTWQVCVSDSAAQDLGSIDAVTLTIDQS